MKFDDRSYLKAYDHNYRVAYEEGLTYLGEGASQKKDLQRVKGLLQRIPYSPRKTKLLDLGCGDGTIGLFLAGLGYQYLGIDISEAAIERSRQRAAQIGVGARFEAKNVLDLRTFQTNEFPIVLDCYCFHMLVLDAHRAVYFENVRRVLQGEGYFILFGHRDEAAYEGPVSSFDEFCRVTGTSTSGIPFQKCQDGEWRDVKGRKIFLIGRAQSLKGYKEELTKAGFKIEYRATYGQNRRNAGFILKKSNERL